MIPGAAGLLLPLLLLVISYPSFAWARWALLSSFFFLLDIPFSPMPQHHPRAKSQLLSGRNCVLIAGRLDDRRGKKATSAEFGYRTSIMMITTIIILGAGIWLKKKVSPQRGLFGRPPLLREKIVYGRECPLLGPSQFLSKLCRAAHFNKYFLLRLPPFAIFIWTCPFALMAGRGLLSKKSPLQLAIINEKRPAAP